MDNYKSLLKSCSTELQSCIDYVKRYSGDSINENLKILSNLAKQYSETDIAYQAAQTAILNTYKYYECNEAITPEEIAQTYQSFLEKATSNCRNYDSHPIWEKIDNITNNKMDGNVQSYEYDVMDDPNTSIDEGIIPSQFQPPIDPITKLVIENPCKNRKCGHVYEYSVIVEHLKKVKGKKEQKIRCPYIGCTNKEMRLSFIIKDSNLKDQIRDYNSQVRQPEQSEFSIEEVL